MQSQRWFYKVEMRNNVGGARAEEVMRDHHFTNIRTVNQGCDNNPMWTGYGQFKETEDDPASELEESLHDDDRIDGFIQSATPFPNNRAPKAPRLPRARKVSDWQREQATLAGMEMGINAYNEWMGNA